MAILKYKTLKRLSSYRIENAACSHLKKQEGNAE